MDQMSGVVKPTETGVELRLRARVRSQKKRTLQQMSSLSPQEIILDIIIVRGRFWFSWLMVWENKTCLRQNRCLWSCFVSIICNICKVITSDYCKPISYFVLFIFFWQLLIVARYQFLGMVLYSVTWQHSQMKSGFLVILGISSVAPTQESVGLMEHGVEWKQFAHVSLTRQQRFDWQSENGIASSHSSRSVKHYVVSLIVSD